MMTIGTAFGAIAVFAVVLGKMSLLFSTGPYFRAFGPLGFKNRG